MMDDGLLDRWETEREKENEKKYIYKIKDFFYYYYKTWANYRILVILLQDYLHWLKVDQVDV